METTKNIKTLFTFDMKNNADTVEWCPVPPYQNYFACGTYCAVPPSQTEGRTVRTGFITLFSMTKEELKEICRVDTTAVLDMRWCPVLLNGNVLLGAATGEGELHIYRLSQQKLKLLTKMKMKKFKTEDFIVLSIDWPKIGDCNLICCSDSDGFVSVVKLENSTLKKLDHWNAHGVEAWTACFDSFNHHIVYTGGDDAKLNVWDLRGVSSVRTQRLDNHSSGVTALSSHRSIENHLVSGSYDASLFLWDARNWSEPLETIASSGGLWRLKWDPQSSSTNLLTACIFSGFEIINPFDKKFLASNREHESLAYGADWCHLEENTGFEGCQRIVALCSFYDHKLSVCLWDETVDIYGDDN